ncbi:hypothetical protein C8R42DRAFT_569466 [Lentinula raphanica]|nr:hypothetical protein C8R42DRAFT_569466 [Lentinula raphanica]
MPHKRAKRSVREQQRSQKGSDLAPSKQSLSEEAIPKSLSRVLNAAQVRQEWRKRRIEDGEPGETVDARKKRRLNGKNHNIPSIVPGESLQHFNKRVETDMRPLVKSAVQSSKVTLRNASRQELSAKKKASTSKPDELDAPDHHHNQKQPRSEGRSSRPVDFLKLSTSAPRRLNDIAQAPPELKRLPRGVSSSKQTAAKAQNRDDVLSMAQKEMMKQERDKAIARYREMKALRKKDHDDEEVDAEP